MLRLQRLRKSGDGIFFNLYNIEEVVEEEPRPDDSQIEFVVNESEMKSENWETCDDHIAVPDLCKVKMDSKVVTLLQIKTLGLKVFAMDDEDFETGQM